MGRRAFTLSRRRQENLLTKTKKCREKEHSKEKVSNLRR